MAHVFTVCLFGMLQIFRLGPPFCLACQICPDAHVTQDIMNRIEMNLLLIDYVMIHKTINMYYLKKSCDSLNGSSKLEDNSFKLI
jgi:hypothetical protein